MYRTIALWACLLSAGASLAQSTYTIKAGDTLGGISKRNGLDSGALLKLNPGLKATRLKLGAKIQLPSKSKAKSSKNDKSRTAAKSPRGDVVGGYTVRSGDNDESIARRLNISSSQLRAMNPGVDWRRLRLGAKLRIRGKAVAQTSAPQRQEPGKSVGTTAYKIQKGENNWTIAGKLGVTVAELNRLNPGKKWSRLQIGQTIRVPGSKKEASTFAVIRSSRVKVNKESVNVRRKASDDAGVVSNIAAGQIAKVVDRDGSWYRLKFSNGVQGWVRGDMLSAVKTSAYVASIRKPEPSIRRGQRAPMTVAEAPRKTSKRPEEAVTLAADSTEVLRQAFTWRGVRYRYGGTSRGGVDCSGFTSSVYRTQGVRLPRTASEQSRVGSSVGRGDLKQGDLVFFRTSRGTRITHVGMFIGNGRFIHASSGGGQVRVDAINERYYNTRFAGAKRVAQDLKVAKGPTERPKRVASKSGAKSPTQEKAPEVAEPQKPRPVVKGADVIER